MYLLALSAVWLQGPSNGSPFTDAHLPFEQLKAPPDTAFDILMASLAMILLSVIAAGVFLGVSKLGSIEEVLRKRAARQAADAAAREERLQRTLQELADKLGRREGGAAAVPEWLSPAVDRLVASIERLERTQKGGASQLANTLAAMASESEAPMTPPLGTPPLGTPPLGAPPLAAPSTGAPASSLAGDSGQRIHARVTSFLEGQGYHDIEIVTPPGEIDAAFVHSGQLIVEARRDGVIHKGKVSLQNGSPAAVELRPSHSIFP